MVTRKTSFPPSVEPPAPTHGLDLQANLIPDAADVPPIPSSIHRPLRPASSREVENAWSSVHRDELAAVPRLPDALRAGPNAIAESSLAFAPGASAVSNPHVSPAVPNQESSPRSSLDSKRSKDFWEDSDDDIREGGNDATRTAHRRLEIDNNTESWISVEHPEPSPGIKRKPVGRGASPSASRPPPTDASSTFASNNPFRQASPLSHRSQGSQELKGKSKASDPGNFPSSTDGFDGLPDGHPARPSASPNLYAVDQQSSGETWKHETHLLSADGPQHQPGSPSMLAVGGPKPDSPLSAQPPLIPVGATAPNTAVENPWASTADLPCPRPDRPSTRVSSHNEPQRLADSVQIDTRQRPETLLLDYEPDVGRSLPTRPAVGDVPEHFDPSEGPPPAAASSRPALRAIIPSAEELAKLSEQRSETYQVKHFNWFDHSSRRLRRSAMLTQNKNGPCPLLALVNALILGAQDASQAALDEALRSREQVTLGLIIETLMDELLSRGSATMGEDEALPDVDELNSFLMRLRTGMNANPRFIPPSVPIPNLMDADDAPPNVSPPPQSHSRLGTFETTTDMKLYGAFSVPLVHGWLPEPGSDAAKAFARSAPTYEDAQALQFGEEELEYKLTHQGLSPTEQNMWEDINAIKHFLKAYPTQLTPNGLASVQESIARGAFAILFRNDHFSTVYKHPESGQLFTLITDAGYADRDEIIWESLVDVSGAHNEFFSGDFMPVSHHHVDEESSTHPAARRSSARLSVHDPAALTTATPTAAAANPLTPQEQQEQHDADFAMALQLQEEEEQRQRAERNQRRHGDAPGGGGGPQRRPPGNIPIPLRSQVEARPSIPPRASHAQNPGVNRPADALAEDAPPAYEEAAKGAPYIPPVGSPLHPSAEPGGMGSNTQLTGTISNTSTSGMDSHPPGPNAATGRRHPGRRLSAYNETSQYYLSPQRPQGLNVAQVGGSGYARPNSVNRQDRDCIVM